MKKNGFTLIEVLAVIIILGVIGLIVMPVVTNSLKESKADLYKIQISNIKEAAKTWSADNINKLPTETGGNKNITLKVLQDEGYIDQNITNPKTDSEFEPTKVCVNIKFNGKKYIYTVLEPPSDCTTNLFE